METTTSVFFFDSVATAVAAAVSTEDGEGQRGTGKDGNVDADEVVVTGGEVVFAVRVRCIPNAMGLMTTTEDNGSAWILVLVQGKKNQGGE